MGYDMMIFMEQDDNQCKRCGQCMSVCPIYQTTFREADVARGKLALLESIQEGALNWSDRLEEILSRCLLCGACAEVCANQVQTTRIMQRYRQRLFEAKTRRNSWGALLPHAMEGNSNARALLKGGALLQALMCKKIPETSGLHLRFPLSFFFERRTVPSLAWTPFLDHWESPVAPQTEGRRIGFFVGCGANYLFPDVARALVKVTERLKATLVIPKEQVCCGLPAYVSGNTQRAGELARKNIQTFESLDLDAILTVCASCGSHLSALPSLFDDDPSAAEAAASLANKHMDAMTFLVEHLHAEAYLEALRPTGRANDAERLRVAYHDPCHLRIGQRTTEAPRRLLAALPGVKLVEAPHPGRCCGHGGDFNLCHLSLSMKIADRRVKDFEKVKADRIVTGCTGCLLQFAEGISQRGLEGRIEVCHPLVLVDETTAPYQIQARKRPDLRAFQPQNTDFVQ